jgi:enoyl-CoA hydratase/carnithine racemase
MKETIASWALWFSIGSFALYLLTAAAQVIAQLRATQSPERAAEVVPSVTSLFAAVKDLVEALSKASPSLVALIASMAYLALAGLASGVYGTG